MHVKVQPMHTIIFYGHLAAVALILLLYVMRTLFILTNKTGILERYSKVTTIPERIIAVLLVTTGIYLITQLPKVNAFMIIKLLFVVGAIPLAMIAYRKKIRTLAVASLVLLIGAFGLARISKRESARGELAGREALDGGELFTAACSQCHGVDGRAGIAGASDLSVTVLNESGLLQVISDGKGSMPGYDDILDENQRAAVAAYVRTLKR